MAELFKQFNINFKKDEHIIQKALTAAMDSGGALSSESLEKIVTDTVIQLSPELALLDRRGISSISHNFNRLLEMPVRGGAQGENATPVPSSAQYARDEIYLKVVRRIGKVQNLIKEATEDDLNVMAMEIENNIRAHVWDLIYYLYYGNANANTYEFNGWENVCDNRRHFSNVSIGAVPETLRFLNDMIDESDDNGGINHNRVFLMSTSMLSLVSELLTNVRLNQGLTPEGLTQVAVEGGWRLNAYRGIPIITTTSLKVQETLTSTVSYTSSATGGSLSDGTYYFWLAPITYRGEQSPGDAVTVTLTGGTTTQVISLSLDEPHKTLVRSTYKPSAMGYKLFYSDTNDPDTATLIRQMPGFTYDEEGSPDKDFMVDPEYFALSDVIADDTVPVHMREDRPLIAYEGFYPGSLALIDLHPYQGLGKFVFTNKGGDKYNGLVTTRKLADIGDFTQVLIKTYGALIDSFSGSSVWTRGVRRA